MKLETKRLLLREFVENDWQAAHEYESDPEIYRYKGKQPTTEQETQQRIRRAIKASLEEPRSVYEFAIVLVSERVLIGRCNLSITNAKHKEAEIGYTLNQSYWCQGYATEATSALLKFGFEELGLHRIFSYHVEGNTASQRVLEKIGMQKEGIFRESKCIRGEWCSMHYYSILEQEWLENPANRCRI